MTSPSRIRVLTPERLDGQGASLVSTNGSQLNLAVKSIAAGIASGGTVNATGVSTASANTLMQRDASGRSQVVDPVAGADIATKAYVDNGLTGYLPVAQKGASSGLATLDSSGFLTTAQLPTLLHRHLGSGTSFPVGARGGDTYFHSGVGCLFSFNGTAWRQSESFAVANLAARDLLVTTYAAVLHRGFRVWQSDITVEWEWDGTAWNWVAGQPITGKCWRTTSFSSVLAINNNYTIWYDTARLSGGVTFINGNAPNTALVLPFDGFYKILANSYLSGGGATGTALWVTNRTRTGVADLTLCRNVDQKNDGADRFGPRSTTVPLKAGDKIGCVVNCLASNGVNYFGQTETFGVSLEVAFIAPLNGATPV